jgi:hypothetical protein
MLINKNKVKYLIILIFCLIINILYAKNTRTITINNQCDFDILVGNIGEPMLSNGLPISCDTAYDYCQSGTGICGEDNICYFRSPRLKFGEDNNSDFYLRQQATKIYEAELIDIDGNLQYKISIAPQYQCSIISGDVPDELLEDLSNDPKETNNTESKPNFDNSISDNDRYEIISRSDDIIYINPNKEKKSANNIEEKNPDESKAEIVITSNQIVNNSDETTISISFENLDINVNQDDTAQNDIVDNENVQDSQIIYSSNHTTNTNKENIKQESNEETSILNKINNQYSLNKQEKSETSNPIKLYQCVSADCDRSSVRMLQGQCTPTSKFYGPYTKVNIELNDSNNDKYHISLENGVNIPVTITPVGSYGDQDVQSNFFCQTTGDRPSNNLTKLAGCNWQFAPPQTSELKPYIFTQINRDYNTDSLASCKQDSDCDMEERCGLKYPDDLIGFNHSGYCGKPIGYYSITTLCNTNNAANSLLKLLKCENNDGNNYLVAADEMTSLERNSVESRCPNSYTELKPNSLSNTPVKFCNNDIYNCTAKQLSVDGQLYNYLESCYNYDKKSPETDICCGCIDWPGIPTDSNHLCQPYDANRSLAPCDIDFSNSPPDCKPKYDTKVSMANRNWVKLMKPYLEWLVKGCPDAKEYKYGDKHSVIQCSSNNEANTPDNNINYLITFCPNNKTLFNNGSGNSNHNFLKDFVATNKIAEETKTQSPLFNEYEVSVNLSNIIIFLIFSIIVIILIAYFALRREED